MPDHHTGTQVDQGDLLWGTINRLKQFFLLEKQILAIIASYSVAIGLFSLIVPLTVQELVNTFALSIQPVMIMTLAGIMAVSLLFMATFRVFQALAVENMIQRLYTRIALGMTDLLPRLKEESFHPRSANYFLEAEFLPRALVALVADLFNVAVTGSIGMTILVLYHPYFLIFNGVLAGGFVLLLIVLGRGGFAITLKVSDLNYEMLAWLQDIAQNLPHFKATASTSLLIKKTDRIVHDYVLARRTRSDILTRTQYRGAGIWQAIGHSSLIGLAGWLLASGQITLGQFVAAEVIVGSLLAAMDTVARRMYAVYFAFTSLQQMAKMFALPKEEAAEKLRVCVPDFGAYGGVRVTCKNVSFASSHEEPVFDRLNLDVEPGEKVAIFSRSTTGKTALAHVLAGLYTPTHGIVRYNDIDLRYLSMESLAACRGLVLDSRLSLFSGTLEENITMCRGGIRYGDIQWALQFTGLDEDVAGLPEGQQTRITAGGKIFPSSFILRLLVARAIVTRPRVLIFDGTLPACRRRRGS
jgi:putative ABC transport system ATP-binding protein